MNSLSWVIYLAGIFPYVQGLFIFLAILSGVLLSSYLLCSKLGHPSERIYGEEEKAFKLLAGKRVYIFAPLLALFWLLAAAVPSERTILLIVASESGERLMQTDEFKKALKKVID